MKNEIIDHPCYIGSSVSQPNAESSYLDDMLRKFPFIKNGIDHGSLFTFNII